MTGRPAGHVAPPRHRRAEPTSPIGRESIELFERARRVMPGGVNSPARSFGGVGGTPPFIESASGAYLTDVDGRRYLDMVGSWGVMLLGHAEPRARLAMSEAIGRGTSYGAPTRGEVELAEAIVEAVPSIEVVRLVNSGTEATLSALRVARAATGRDAFIKFRGGYHGHADPFLVDAGSGAATLGIPSSPGVPASCAAQCAVAEYNDLGSVLDILRARPSEIAAIIVEPVAGNMGCIPPVEGFLEGLAGACAEHGALLIFDEVMTGFRVGPGGAQERYGVTPDLTTLGKIIGGGLPVGAYGGREELMRLVAPDGHVYQAGTLSGNPVAVAAGLTTLRRLAQRPVIYERLEALGGVLDRGFAEIAATLGVPITWNRVGAMGSLFFTSGPVTDWQTAACASRARFQALFHGLLARGVHLPPSPFEAWFWSHAHRLEDIVWLLDQTREVLEGDEVFRS